VAPPNSPRQISLVRIRVADSISDACSFHLRKIRTRRARESRSRSRRPQVATLHRNATGRLLIPVFHFTIRRTIHIAIEFDTRRT